MHKTFSLLTLTFLTIACAAKTPASDAPPGSEDTTESGEPQPALQNQARESYHKAVTMQKAQNYALSITYFTQVLDLVGDPNDPLYKKAQARLQSINSEENACDGAKANDLSAKEAEECSTTSEDAAESENRIANQQKNRIAGQQR